MYQDFPSKILCLTERKIFLGESFTIALVLGIEKVWIRVGEYQDFLSKTYCLTVPKISIGESFTVALFSVSGRVWKGGGASIQIFRRKLYVSQCGKISYGSPLLLH